MKVTMPICALIKNWLKHLLIWLVTGIFSTNLENFS